MEKQDLPNKPFARLLQNIKNSGKSYKGSRRRVHIVDLTIDELKDIYIKQEGKCYYSHKTLDLNEVFIPYSPKAISADRIDNRKSYRIDNVVLCMRFYNNGRNSGSMEDVMDIIDSNKGLLYRTRCYLIGSIEANSDGGVGWRNQIKKDLEDVGIIFFDPCDKPFMKDLSETVELNKQMKLWRKRGNFKKLSDQMREIRSYDLGLCDRADFIIFNYDPEILTCGSWEELFISNQSKKAIFFVCQKGLDRIPLWMYGVLPYKYFYTSMKDVEDVLRKIDKKEIEIDSSRWRLLNHNFR